MGKTSLVIFKKDCMGCHACEIACKQEHGLGVGPRLIRVTEKSPDFTPIYCHHCTKAPCLESCPVEAIIRDVKRNGRLIAVVGFPLRSGVQDKLSPIRIIK